MHLAEVKTFLSEVLDRIGKDLTIRDATEVKVDDGYWGDLCAYELTSSVGQDFYVLFRLRQKPTPSYCVDFLNIANAQVHRHLVIVYLESEQHELSTLDSKFIPANQWQSISHVDWESSHPFNHLLPSGQTGITRTLLNNESSILREGGTRKEESTPLVSIVTIVLNGDKYLEQTIQSVIHQKDPTVEYILVDGGSTDDSLKIINQYAAYIDYWISEPDKGLYDALNRGINLCRGKFIGAIHSNDFYASHTIVDLKTAIAQQPDTSFYYGNLWYLDKNRSWLRGREIKSTFQMVLYGDFFHPTTFINRQAYIIHGNYDQNYHIAGDYDLGIRFWKAGLRFHYIPSAMAYFRLGGLSGNLFGNQWQRHQVRVVNGEFVLYSLTIVVLVLGNYCVKTFAKKCLNFFSRTT